MVSAGLDSCSLEDILNKTSEAKIIAYYLGITSIPCIIKSPLRVDKKPSFGIYSPHGDRVYFTDFATKESGGIYDLLSKLWGVSYQEVLIRINKDILKFNKEVSIYTTQYSDKSTSIPTISTELLCTARSWKSHDLEYWASYGISQEWLDYAEVYPISHTIIIKNGKKYTFSADKYAYVYVEHKENKETLKVYQPFNIAGYKWTNKHDKSVISLWTKVPEYGEYICICSSLKDALCVWANTGIPCLAVQGEGYNMSDTAINELKRRYKYKFVCFDNDEPGLIDGQKFAEKTGFINIVLPQFEEGKDCSDLYHSLQDPQKFKDIIVGLFKEKIV